MQFELTKNSDHPLKIFIYKDQANSLVANLAYSVDESMKDLLVQNKIFTFIGTIDAGEVVDKIRFETEPPKPTAKEQKEMKKSEFIFGLMYTADKFVEDPKDQKALKRIISKITLV